MERLLSKYINIIVEFEETLREKYQKDIELKVKTTTSFLGEELHAISEQGDALTLYEDDGDGKLITDYYFVPTSEVESFTIKVNDEYTSLYEWKLDVTKFHDGYTYRDTYGRLLDKRFKTIEELIEHVDKHDNSSMYDVNEDINESSYKYSILKKY